MERTYNGSGTAEVRAATHAIISFFMGWASESSGVENRGRKNVSHEAPKSAVELAMERFRRQDAEAGGESAALTDQQKAAIGDARRDYDAKVAEAEILLRSKMVATFEPDVRLELEANHRRDLRQLASSRDKKIEAIREGSAST